jgi:hypothetical protein
MFQTLNVVRFSSTVAVREVFSVDLENGRWEGEVSNEVKVKAIDKASLYLVKIRKITFVDTQAIRTKLLRQLEGLFDLAIAISKGKVRHLSDEDGNEYKITLRVREKWARIAAYTGQVMGGLALGYDEKQLQTDLKKLEQMVNEVRRHRKATEENNPANVPGRV